MTGVSHGRKFKLSALSLPLPAECYEPLLSRCNHLLGEEDLSEEEQELSRIRPACVNVFLLLLLGYTLFCRQEQQNH